MEGLFPRVELELLAFELEPSNEVALAALSRLMRFQSAWRSGALSGQKESNLEQSFNERVFAEVFEYESIFGSSNTDGTYTAMPKLFVRRPKGHAFPDLALGWFRSNLQQAVVTAELKGPGADLDRPQGGNYGGKSPGAQALEAAAATGAEWCIVSNLDECRLYRVSDGEHYETVRLTEIDSPHAFRRAVALFSSRALLGTSADPVGALSRLDQRLRRGNSMLVTARPGNARLIQRVRPAKLQGVFPFAKLSRSLGEAFQAVPGLAPSNQVPRFADEALYVDRLARGYVWQRIAVNKAGVLTCSGLVTENETIPKIFVDPANIALEIADYISFAWAFYAPLRAGALWFEWELEDLTTEAVVHDSQRLGTSPVGVHLKCQAGISRTSYPAKTWDHDRGVNRDDVERAVEEAVSELLFPFDGTDEDGRLWRFAIADGKLKELLRSRSSLASFK